MRLIKKLDDFKIVAEIKKCIDDASLRPSYCEYVKNNKNCPHMDIIEIAEKRAKMCECGLYCEIYRLALSSEQFLQKKIDFEKLKFLNYIHGKEE